MVQNVSVSSRLLYRGKGKKFAASRTRIRQIKSVRKIIVSNFKLCPTRNSAQKGFEYFFLEMGGFLRLIMILAIFFPLRTAICRRDEGEKKGD